MLTTASGSCGPTPRPSSARSRTARSSRRCRARSTAIVGAKIGPLFAEDERVADTLLVGLLAAAKPGSDVFVDIPQSNANAARLPEAHDMRPTFETARMYRNGRHPEALDQVFGVTTLEFG